jgi:hypothetical protein
MTGGDPYTFKPIIGSYFILWFLAWLIHIASWLLIPALIGIVITDAADNIKREQLLHKSLNDFLTQLGIPSQDASELVPELEAKIEQWVKEEDKNYE